MNKKKKENDDIIIQETDLLNLIEQIATSARFTETEEKLMAAAGEPALILSKELNCSTAQAIFFSLTFNLNFNNCYISLSDIANYLKCEPIYLAKYIRDFEALCRLKLLRKDMGERRIFGQKRNQQNHYYVPGELVQSICENNEIKRFDMKTDNLEDMTLLMSELFEAYSTREIEIAEFKQEILSLLYNNKRFAFSRAILTSKMDHESLIIVLKLCQCLLKGYDTVELGDLLTNLFHDNRTQIAQRRQFMREEHELLKKNLVCFEAGSFKSEFNIKLTEKFTDKLFEGEKDLIHIDKARQNSQLILHEVINEKPLFYSGEEERNLQFIEESLMPENYRKLSDKLKSKGLSQGVNVLLYGPPGTGKTESVYQLARKTGRDIRQIDISETKSYWFGESEKIIKKVFDKYRAMVEKSKVAPILFFNEADGIFCKRKETVRSNTGQTENAIQNIILQEMETMNGILIATTNMAGNLDKAFERRFLYKILFEKPDLQARCMIWETRLPSVSADFIRYLAEHFDITGGQIDNVVRKYTMHQILKDRDPDPQEIITWCREENMQDEYSKIGFRYR
jgi:Cdc6-like AAA superfamily ATPase